MLDKWKNSTTFCNISLDYFNDLCRDNWWQSPLVTQPDYLVTLANFTFERHWVGTPPPVISTWWVGHTLSQNLIIDYSFILPPAEYKFILLRKLALVVLVIIQKNLKQTKQSCRDFPHYLVPIFQTFNAQRSRKYVPGIFNVHSLYYYC